MFVMKFVSCFVSELKTVKTHLSLKIPDEKIEQFDVLSLPMRPEDKKLTDCFEHFFSLERNVEWTPDGEDAMKHSISRDTIYCDRQYKLLNAPKYVILFLKRSDGGLQKRLNHIAFPLDGLIIAPYMEDNSHTSSYSLK